MTETHPKRDARWLALFVLIAGSLMIVLDSTIVNVALPSIREDLGFSEGGLAWVVNAYLLTFGGFLLLGGRLGDLFGHRKLFMTGIGLFTVASLLCGLAESQGTLVMARAVQGFGGAIVSAVSLSLMMTMFTDNHERAKAMGYFGFVSAGGGALGVLLGGVLTDVLNWHWIFLVNIPIGVGVLAATTAFIPKSRSGEAQRSLDIAGAILVTASLLLATYAIVNGNGAGWTSMETLGLLGGALALFVSFLVVESKIAVPLVPLSLFKLRNLSTANAIGVLWAAAMFAWFFLSALYLQVVLGYDPLKVGLSFLPGSVAMGACSLGLSAFLVNKFGVRKPLVVGLAFASLGLLWFSRAPEAGTFVFDILPGMLLLGLGGGIAFNPLLLSAMSEVKPQDSGLASGIVNTSFMMGGALGLAILASVAAAKTGNALMDGASQLSALMAGYHAAFFIGALCAAAATALAALVLKNVPMDASADAPSMH